MVRVEDEAQRMARSIRVEATHGAWFSLTHYGSSGHQPAHFHDFHQISVLVGGSLSERLHREDYELHCAAIGFKPVGVTHEDRWGHGGALVFSINLPADWPLPCRPNPHWRRLDPAFPLAATIASSLAAPVTEDVSSKVETMLSLLSGKRPYIPPPPRWIESLRETLALEPALSVADAAVGAGVDRAHLARTFRKIYGVPPSVHRRRALACRAFEAIVRGRGRLSEIAYDLGFADQAHMSRVLRVESGLSPQRLRALLTRKVTSIQDAAAALA